MSSARPALTTAGMNQWFKSALSDPARKFRLKQDRTKLLLSEMAAPPEQSDSLALLPAKNAKDLQAAIEQVADRGGTIQIILPLETAPGRHVVQPVANEQADFSVGIVHCTFDAYFRHWHCGWGPASHKLDARPLPGGV